MSNKFNKMLNDSETTYSFNSTAVLRSQDSPGPPDTRISSGQTGGKERNKLSAYFTKFSTLKYIWGDIIIDWLHSNYYDVPGTTVLVL